MRTIKKVPTIHEVGRMSLREEGLEEEVRGILIRGIDQVGRVTGEIWLEGRRRVQAQTRTMQTLAKLMNRKLRLYRWTFRRRILQVVAIKLQVTQRDLETIGFHQAENMA